MTFFSAYDLQCNRYFDSGRNSKTKHECENKVLEMLVGGCGDEEIIKEFENGKHFSHKKVSHKKVPLEMAQSSTISNSGLLDMFQVRIDKHKTKVGPFDLR